ncbi:MAG: hypothetical protein VB050_03740, partial [Geobacteraceae bacterium]|nr:hypothetical protein [Geobacteraceae bacterium]
GEDRKLLTTEAQGRPEERTSGVILYDKVGNPLESRDGNNNIHKTYYNVYKGVRSTEYRETWYPSKGREEPINQRSEPCPDH